MGGAGELVAALSDGLSPVAALVWPLFAVFARLSTFFLLVPVFGERAVPVRVRLGVAMLFAVMLYPVLQPDLMSLAGQAAAPLLVTEAATGFVFGLSLRLAVHALQIAGMIVSNALSLSQPLGEGIASEPNTTVSTLLMVAGVTLLATVEAHIAFVGVLADSFAAIPLGALIDLQASAHWLTTVTVGLLKLCMSIALPFIVLNFAYNLILGFLNRAMPQLLVSFVGIPGITLAGLLLLVISVSAMLEVWLGGVDALLLDLGQ